MAATPHSHSSPVQVLRRPTASRTVSHSNFATRAPTDDAAQLDRRLSVEPSSPQREESPSPGPQSGPSVEPQSLDDGSSSPFLVGTGLRSTFPSERITRTRARSTSKHSYPTDMDPTAQQDERGNQKKSSSDAARFRTSAPPRPVGGTDKLGTFAGVFVPTSLNVLSILMFLRFGFILGQTGVVGMMGMLIVCYAINLVTTMSISAIATNGTVRGGGAYYLISRSLGPEFGGSIGIVFYLGFVFNTGMNAVGLIDCFVEVFGSENGAWAQWMPEGFWWQYLWATVVLVLCTAICLAGSALFARCSNGLLAILLIATLSIPVSALFLQPFENAKLGIRYTGLSLATLKENLLPHLTKGAAGSQLKGKETWQDLFGILFPATGGIFAGASMSGNLKHPSKAIPKGTLYGLVLTFISYKLVILAMGASISRGSLYRNTNVIQLVNLSETLILLGEFATSFFSALMGVIGSAKLLQALARDHLIPGLSVFGQGTKVEDEPTYAIIITYLLAQISMLSNINALASFVTMTYLMTFLVTNLACFLLKIASAPNFRPSFHYFNWQTALIGTIVSGATMFFVDGLNASACVGLLIFIFLIIHYTTPPKPWGDVSQSLIYHQVRKYLLRLRQDHVKFWRPQILLLINDPRRQYKLIQFCNSLKKGGLFVLGHVIVTQDFAGAVPEARRQQMAWTKYIDFSRIKAFINIAISPAIEWGSRNIVLSAGLGGMRPNIVIMGIFNLTDLRLQQPLIDIPSAESSTVLLSDSTKKSTLRKRRNSKNERLSGKLPTDSNRAEGAITPQSYVTILEDLLLSLQINVAIAKGFQDIDFPVSRPTTKERGLAMLGYNLTQDDDETTTKFIDLWPIQMSAEIASDGERTGRNVMTTNFDTYTLILQLGCILTTVPSWRRAYKLRVSVFVEYESDVEEERKRVGTLLYNLRIQADIRVFWLASGDISSYEVVVNGKGKEMKKAAKIVDEVLEDEEWWQDVKQFRGHRGSVSAAEELAQVEGLLGLAKANWPEGAFQHGRRDSNIERFEGLKKLLKRKRRKSLSGVRHLGASYGMRTHQLAADLVGMHDSNSDSDSSGGVLSSDGYTSDGAYSEADADAFESSDEQDRPQSPIRRMKTVPESIRNTALAQEGQKSHREYEPQSVPNVTFAASTRRHTALQATPSNTRTTSEPDLANPEAPPGGDSLTNLITSSSTTNPAPATTAHQAPNSLNVRPPTIRHQSVPKFTSRPTPRTTVASDDGAGRSIMFTEQPSPPPRHATPYKPPRSQPQESQSTPISESTTTAPLSQSIPLSFNDLPCRAQHLILNELITAQSADTAVMFTTLPSPVKGTCESEADSVRYLNELEVLCKDLPPVLLVHSNSMTVTMNL